jgi:hypothetical protein
MITKLGVLVDDFCSTAPRGDIPMLVALGGGCATPIWRCYMCMSPKLEPVIL